MTASVSLYFDLKVSNTRIATVSIRRISATTWAYEIGSSLNGAHKVPPHQRGTVEWAVDPEDDNPEYLYLVSKVLGNYYADLSTEGIWQE